MFPLDPIALRLGPISIYWYAIFIVSGMICVYLLSNKKLKALGLSADDIDMLYMYTIFAGIIGARLWSVAFNIEHYLPNPISIFYFHQGGLAIHGGIILGSITAFLFLKKKKIDFLSVADIIMPLVLIAQAIGRWGNFFNQEAYGNAVSQEFLSSFLPNFIVQQMYINGQYYHPTFLYESVLNIIGFIVIAILVKKINLKKGSSFALYFIWYGIIRYFIEGLRTDSLFVNNTSLALVIFMLTVSIIVLFAMIYLKNQADKIYIKDYLLIPVIAIVILLFMVFFILNPNLHVRMAKFTSVLFVVFGSTILYYTNRKQVQ